MHNYPSASPAKAHLALVDSFVKTEKPTFIPEAEVNTTHTLNLIQHLPEGMFKTYVQDVAKMCDIPANTSLLIGLGIVSSVASRCYSVMYRNGECLPLGEYITCSQPPAVGKSRLLKTFQHPIHHAQKAIFRDYNQRAKQAEAEGRLLEEVEPVAIFSTDATPEGVDSTLAHTNGFFALASAEQGLLNSLMGSSYGSDGKKNNNDLALKGFNGEYHASKRTTRKGYQGDVVGAITCFAQEGAIHTILTKNEGVGIAERFLMLAEPNLLGKRTFEDFYPDELSQNTYNRILQDLTKRAMTANEAFEDLPAFRLSKAAWDQIKAFRCEIEPYLADNGKYSTATMRGTAGKVDMHIMKIATLLAILEDRENGEVPLNLVEAAINIMRDMLDYLLSLLMDMEVIGNNAFENSIIEYLGKQPRATRKLIRTNKCNGKPWSEVPKKDLSAKINETVDSLIRKGILTEVGTLSGRGKFLRLMV